MKFRKIRWFSIFLAFSIAIPTLFSVIASPTAIKIENNSVDPIDLSAAMGIIGFIDGTYVEGYEGFGNNLNLDVLEPGDVLLMKGCIVPALEALLIGWDWTHTAMYVGDVNGDGIGDIVDAWGNGVRIIDVENILDVTKVGVYRVSCDTSIKQAAINWIVSKEGVPYDTELANAVASLNKWDAVKEINGDAYVCSELVWAAYMVASNEDVDIDASDWAWTWENEYTVRQDEIADDPLTIEIVIAT